MKHYAKKREPICAVQWTGEMDDEHEAAGREAVIYAGTAHTRASDNPVPRYSRPIWLPDRLWQGPEHGKGVFAGPSGTPIAEALQ